MPNTYRETSQWNAGKMKHFIKAKKKGTLIYQELRNIPIQGMIDEEDGVSLLEQEYLVFDIPDELDDEHFREYKKNWNTVEFRWFPGWTEVACQSPRVFHNGLLRELEELGYITYTVKVYPNAKNEYPYYVNPKGWRLVYNLINAVRGAIQKRNFNFLRREYGEANLEDGVERNDT
ncbi:hypothetical protein [Paenibacillus polymyxa]|uniref:Uncharacterized protein n=1 Tax=Paenibacillus polymyxa (strain SC2) TaxID=886882 RepID=E3EJZ4_PAEPS|nr:hypothetical protein [Paenibacillus polymyxa]ADO60013.2 hypothetical protein PPSC2_28120 [Paenibacillus polymyxa SC2]WPQ59770.1 hypothetical protein SKN87_26130 [Paenibacillus polymyxa]